MKQLIIILLFFISSAQPVLSKELVLSVHPFLRAEEVVARFTPIANYLGEQLGIKIVVRVGASYDEHIQAIGRDQVDIAYMGPASYVSLVNQYGNKPTLARIEMDGKPTFHGYIVTRSDSAIKSLADLKGQSFAFGDPKSTMSYVVPHFMLVEAGVLTDDTVEHIFLGSHENVALAVLSGDYAAGALKPAVFKKFEARGLRVLAVSPEISEHVFVSRANLTEKTVAALRKAMFAASQSPDGAAALRYIKSSATGLIPVQDADYDSLRTIINSLKEAH